MRIIRCDTCKQDISPNEYGLPPVGWVTVVVQAAAVAPALEYCSVSCAIVGLQQRGPSGRR